MKRINMIIAAVLAVAVIMASGVVLTGCGGKKNTDPTAATAAPTAPTAATEKATANAAEGSSSQNAQSGNNGSSQSVASSAGNTGATLSDDGYIDENSALDNVRALIGTGGKILSYSKGYAPDGTKAWVVVTEPITTADGPATVTYYTNYQFCYPASDGSAEAGGDYVDEATALQNVREQIGSGGKILDYYQGTTPNGDKAWVVTVEPVTTGDGPETVIYYVNHQFCYPAS